jgi:hypothetical protein
MNHQKDNEKGHHPVLGTSKKSCLNKFMYAKTMHTFREAIAQIPDYCDLTSNQMVLGRAHRQIISVFESKII